MTTQLQRVTQSGTAPDDHPLWSSDKAGAVPRVSIGIPVFNGQNYLEEALRSVLSQSYEDIEIILSDNASTDATESICRMFARQDERVRYSRLEENIGGAGNFNRVFSMARGPYFKWVAHDDVCLPDFVERCVEALDEDLGAVLAYPSYYEIDGAGHRINSLRSLDSDASSHDPVERFRRMVHRHHAALAQFGVIRTEALLRTSLIGPYSASDHVLLAQLVLQGRFVRVPDQLMVAREHAGRSVHKYKKAHDRIAFWDPSQVGRIIFPTWRHGWGLCHAVWSSSLTSPQKAACSVEMVKWALKGKRTRLLRDLVRALQGWMAKKRQALRA